ncbi:MAG TPA: ribonuclease Z [Solirubrobacteraceae bacterium]|jgi:ribonuclease Z
MDLSLFFAGTGGSVPSPRRGLPAILVRRGGDRLLFDCGEGTQRQLMRSAGLADVGCVFITHFHADHWLGLPGMLKSFGLREREQPLSIYGPPGIRKLMDDTRFIYGRLPYELTVWELEPSEPVDFDGYTVTGVPVSHRGVSAFGYILVEESRPGHLDPELAEQLGVTPGPDFGRLTRGETVNGVSPEQVMGPTREGRKVVISGDTSPCEALTIASHSADVLVHEATFAEEELERARQTGHSTARQAAEVAREAHVTLLALTHISTRYPGGDLREEARAVFAATEAPRDFDTIEIPFPEKGDPELVRWSRRPPPPQGEPGENESAGEGNSTERGVSDGDGESTGQDEQAALGESANTEIAHPSNTEAVTPR